METFQQAAEQRTQNRQADPDPEQDIVDHQALAEANPIDHQMLDIEHPRRKAVTAQRKKKYDARRKKKSKAVKTKTDRISRRDVI